MVLFTCIGLNRNAIVEMLGHMTIYAHNQLQKTESPSTATTGLILQAEPLVAPVHDGAEGGAAKSQSYYQNLLDSILDQYLVERVHDVSAYTRAKVLKVWTDIVRSNALPGPRFGAVARLAVDRLSDKTVNVRKAAVGLITMMMDQNPFNAHLDKSSYELECNRLVALLNQRTKAVREVVVESVTAASIKAEEAEEPTVVEGEPTVVAVDEEEVLEELSRRLKEDDVVVQIRAQQEECVQAMGFMEAVEEAGERIKEFFRSKASTDVLEALRFFTRALNFGVNGSVTLLPRCL